MRWWADLNTIGETFTLAYCKGKYKNVTEFCEVRELPYDYVRKVFKKFENESADKKPDKTGHIDRPKVRVGEEGASLGKDKKAVFGLARGKIGSLCCAN